jgi:serine/threonine protein kinase
MNPHAELGLPTNADGDQIRRAYLRLAKEYHPDMPSGSTARFQRIQQAYEALTSPTFPLGPYTVSVPFATGSLADIYRVDEFTVVKLVREARNNDLMDREAKALGQLEPAYCFPKLKNRIRVDNRRANVLELPRAEHLTLSDLAGKISDYRHTVWLGNRLWAAVARLAHVGLVHGAIMPEHIVVGPQSHGIVLLDWCYCVEAGNKAVAAPANGMAWLAPETYSAERRLGPQADIYAAGKTLASICPVIKPFKAFFDWVCNPSAATRPRDAWDVLELWKRLAKETFGEPKYIELTV